MDWTAGSQEPVAPLVRRAHAGERDAQANLCRRFLPAVRAFARRRLRTQDAVDEFAQDVLLRLIEALQNGAVNEAERVGGFVLGICKHLALDRVRQNERRAALWQEHSPMLAELFGSPRNTPTMQELKLEDCLTQLSQRARDVVRFSYVDGKDHGEIAAALAISEANARVLRHRTLGALRECMKRPLPWEAA